VRGCLVVGQFGISGGLTEPSAVARMLESTLVIIVGIEETTCSRSCFWDPALLPTASVFVAKSSFELGSLLRFAALTGSCGWNTVSRVFRSLVNYTVANYQIILCARDFIGAR
jgi:hypothetical protein